MMNHWKAIGNQVNKHFVLSFGGGVQSVASMVLASQGKIPYDTFVFSNVGHDSENPDTLDYLESTVKPFMACHGLEFHEVQRVNRAGEPVTLYDYLMSDNKSVPIPAVLPSGSFGKRACTSDWKIKVIDKWIKANRTGIVYIGLGISVDEFQRVRISQPVALNKHTLKINKYPLIDLRLTRQACIRIIQEAGLPIPSESSCYFCPFHNPKRWLNLSVHQPELFQKAVGIEQRINEKSKSVLRLHGSRLPLEQMANGQMSMFEEHNCESGYCMV
jgi:hypothetical protein